MECKHTYMGHIEPAQLMSITLTKFAFFGQVRHVRAQEAMCSFHAC